MKALYIVDMQEDFIRPTGALPVPDAESIIPNCRELIDVCQKNNVPILGSVDRHFPDDKELKKYPPHCMDGTPGQKIITELQIENTYFIEDKVGEMGKFMYYSYPDLIDIIKLSDGGAIMFEKQYTDVFTNPSIAFVIEKMALDPIFVIGVAGDICVPDVSLGFLKRPINVNVIHDAIKSLSAQEEKDAMRLMASKGANFMSTDQAIEILTMDD